MTACVHVKAFRFLLRVVLGESYAADEVRWELFFQFGALGSIPNLREICIDVEIPSLLDINALERPLMALRPTVSAIISIARSAAITLAITSTCTLEYTSEGILPILTQLFEPLAGMSVAKLHLSDIHRRRNAITAFHGEPAYEAFKQLATGLRRLCLDGQCWIVWCNDPVALPTLENLEVSASRPFVRPWQDFMAKLPRFINACVSRLRRLGLALDGEAEVDSCIGQAGISHILQLTTLELRKGSLMEIHNLISTLPCHTMSVDIETSHEWIVLFELLSVGRFQQLQRLELFWRPFSNEWEADIGIYAQIRGWTLNSNVTIEFHAKYTKENDALYPDEAVGWLEALQGDLVSLDCCVRSVGLEHMFPRDSFQEINLSKLQSFRIRVEEELNDKQYTASHAFYDIVLRMRAPCLREIVLDVISPITEYLPALCHALERDAFPMVRVMSGTYAIEDCSTGWESTLNSFRRSKLLDLCRAMSIDTENLSFELGSKRERRSRYSVEV